MLGRFDIDELNRYKVWKLVDEIHEIIDFIDDGYHNWEIGQLIDISNMLVDSLNEEK